jgi:hypothetical protein
MSNGHVSTGRVKPSKDPIRDMPLRDPGESLRNELDDLLFEGAFPWFAIAIFAVISAALEWWRWWTGAPPSPVLLTLFAIAVTTIAAWKWRGIRTPAKRLKTGLKGERATGQLLQSELLPLGYQVFHDCCFEGFNVDHVAIGPGGVFAIETKTRFKRHGYVRVTYDGRRVLVDGFAPDRDPVTQAKAGASKIKEVLAEITGRQVSVRPVVLFPGWYVEGNSSGAETWVLESKAFITWVRNESEQLTKEQIFVLASGLARFIRRNLES